MRQKQIILIAIVIGITAFFTATRIPSQQEKQFITSPSITSPIRSASDGCQIGGCNGEICSQVGTEQEDTASTCMWQAQHVCYKTARCEHQKDDTCGWTQTPELIECLAQT